jgi:outer membrane protein TolC
MRKSSPFRTAALAAPLVLACACQAARYRPQPLQPAAHLQRVASRDLGSQGVAAYAASLARLNPGAPGVFDAADGLDAAEAEIVALLFNPELRMARLEARVPLLAARHAGLPEDPELDLDLLRIVEGISSPWVLGGALRFTVPLSGRLAAERRAACADADAAVRTARAAEGRVLAGLRATWNEWTSAGERLALVGAYLEEFDSLLSIARTQREAGQIGGPELGALELERLQREDQMQVLRAAQERLEATIRRTLGLVPDAPVTLLPGFTAAAPDLDPEVERTRLRENNLELAEARARHDLAEAELALEMQKQLPDLRLGPSAESDAGSPRIGVGSGLTLPLVNANRQAVAEARARRDAARGAYEARLEMLLADLHEARAEAARLRARRAWLQARMAPRTEQQLAELRQLSELGDMDVLLLQGGLGALLDTKAQLLELRRDEALADARIHALISPLDTPLWRDRTVRGTR